MKMFWARLLSIGLIGMLLFSMLPVQTQVQAETPTDLFFSEYIEGSSNNKALEIYNGTGADVDLAADGYSIQMFFNGSSSAGLTINLTGIVANSDVFVIAQASANATILSQSDQTNGAGWFNGDDAVVLRKGTQIIDSIGQIGFDPGAQWGSDLTSTADNTLRRNPDVCAGDPDATNVFDPSVEWVGFAQDTFDGLGTHVTNCGGPVVNTDIVINEIDYDQPSTDYSEFVELYNFSSETIDLTGWSLVFVNGYNSEWYASFDLSGFTLDSGDYFVVCGNSANVANCDLDVSPDSNLIQNGSPDAVALYYQDRLIDTVSYEGNTSGYTEGYGSYLEDFGAGSISRCPNGVDTNQNNVDFAFSENISPGEANLCPVCGDPYTPIYEVQGDGSESPLKYDFVTIEGVVVGDVQTGLGGFYVQDPVGDGNTATSDGVYVYSTLVDVNVGDNVRVSGRVTEYYDLTEISPVTRILVCESNASVEPTVISFPTESKSEYEAYEGMLVKFGIPLIFSEFYNFDRYGEIVMTPFRQYQGTSLEEPGPDAIALQEQNLLNQIKLDDGRSSQNPEPAIHPNGLDFTMENRFRGGDSIYNLTGVMDYNYGEYKLQPISPDIWFDAEYANDNERTEFPDAVSGNLEVASFNVLNYFTTLGSRGADTPLEFERQRAKIFAALEKIDADVVGLIEIENNEEAIADLVSGLNNLLGAEVYAYVDTGIIGTDEIKQAFIYKPETVSLVGDFAILDSSVDPRFIDTRNRPALAQTFMDNSTGGIFTVVVNHLKSKGSSCEDISAPGEIEDPDLGDGAGNCNLTRKLAAEAMVDWLAMDPTGSGDADFLIIGDLNSYAKEDPIDAILLGSDDMQGHGDDYFNLVDHYIGAFAYSYLFDGQLGYLDHALAVQDLFPEVKGTTIWHINADEPDIIDYDLSYNPAWLFAPDAYRSSDHDPVIIGLDVCDEIAPTLEVSASPDYLWPVNHKYVEVETTVIALDNFDDNVDVELISVTSNEPDDGLGDGDTPDDIVVIDDFHFLLRAERSGTGDGRIYTITYKATDDCGNVTFQSVEVYAPLSMGN